MNESKRLKALKQRDGQELKKKKVKEKKKKRVANVRKGGYTQSLQQAGLPFPAPMWIIGVVGVSFFLGAFLWENTGALTAAAGAPCFAYYFTSIFVAIRSDKRRRQVVRHLPGFIDTLAASLATGYNMEIAVEHATNSLPDGVMRKEFDRVIRMIHKGMTLEEGLTYVVQRIAGQEIISMVITIRIFADMGGRALEPFKRLGYKIREQQAVLERAGRDLVGTKQAFFVIFALSIMAPIFLLLSQPQYILTALKHPVIRYIMQGAIVVQFICFMAFKKFTSLKV